MRIGLFTDGLKHLPRREALAWAAEHGITDVEMSVGTWGARTHLDLEALLTDQRSIDDLRRDLDDTGIRFSAVNAAGPSDLLRSRRMRVVDTPMWIDPIGRSSSSNGWE